MSNGAPNGNFRRVAGKLTRDQRRSEFRLLRCRVFLGVFLMTRSNLNARLILERNRRSVGARHVESRVRG